MISPSRVVHKSTCRIICDGSSVGTCFWYYFADPELPDLGTIGLVTNKHVVNGRKSATVRFDLVSRVDGSIKFHDHHWNDIQSVIVMHPDNEIDLCVIPMTDAIYEIEDQEYKIDFVHFHQKEPGYIESLPPIQDVYMTGYPSGLWDEVNNRPITRKGISATDINQDWNGRPDFVIDMACFPGSSGSPVFIMSEGGFSVENGISLDAKLVLLGVLHSGPQFLVSGDVEEVDVPTAVVTSVRSKIMMNLGYVVKAKKLNDFIPLLMP